MLDATNATNNTALGCRAMLRATGAINNVAVGHTALSNLSTGQTNTALGMSALATLPSGKANTAVGYYSMSASLAGEENTAVGFYALNKTQGSYNAALGTHALYGGATANATGTNNSAIGAYAMYGNESGSYNACIGYRALYNNTSGESNTGVGSETLRNTTTGGANTGIGYCALYGNVDGNNNIGIGYNAGRYLANGTTANTSSGTSLFIGNNAKAGTLGGQVNQIVIGHNARSYDSNTAHIGNSSVTTISYGPGVGTAFTNRSDPRIKEDIAEADITMCYADIKKLPLHRFRYKDFVGNTGDQHMTGFLSTEFKELFPKAVHAATSSFDMVDENGAPVYEDIEVEEFDFVPEEITDLETGETRTENTQVRKVTTVRVPKQVVIEDCESIDTSQVLPTLLGAVQEIMKKVEKLEAKRK